MAYGICIGSPGSTRIYALLSYRLLKSTLIYNGFQQNIHIDLPPYRHPNDEFNAFLTITKVAEITNLGRVRESILDV